MESAVRCNKMHCEQQSNERTQIEWTHSIVKQSFCMTYAQLAQYWKVYSTLVEQK